MGIFDYVSDLYAAMTVQEAYAEEPQKDEDSEGGEEKEESSEGECLKSAQCAPLKHHYDECAERVKHQEEQYGKASEDCVEEFFHMMHCATQCAAPKLFKQLR
ncbi:Cytochrome b-c1 complex subunit 6, mitochondrial [Pseudocercospora fuligena]|uniref:Cytochrome b-c1 complex subunit 6, mitochondrial n=1 Tax=Pseudocercospora fuligena TaxID=685502 RepID=A0A8H6RK08_9PEZI|nr:Cytochrome b-c1 complex subunit 6, mitochondrial [Pseudocercospora fuligena]